MISIIVAMANDRAIGRNGDLLCYLPADLKHFKQITSGHPILMGRKTFESLPNGALPNRKNVVITRNAELQFANVTMTNSLEAALEAAGEADETFIIGGASIYAAALPVADRMYLTFIDASFADADTFFPNWNPDEWVETAREEHAPDEKNAYAYTFVTLDRRVR